MLSVLPLQRIDHVCDYIPIVSTVTNLIDLFQKYICMPRSEEKNYYFVHLQEKSVLRSLVLLVPLVGNIVIIIYDFKNNIDSFNLDSEWVNPKTPIQGLAYKIEREGRLCGYLFGSQHDLPEGFQITAKLEVAISKCDTVYLEIELNPQQLRGRSGFESKIGENRRVLGLEEYENRALLYVQFVMAMQAANCNEVASQTKAWWLGKQKGVEEVLKKYSQVAPNEMESLVFARTSKWMPRMVGALNHVTSKPVAICVGALHLFDAGCGKGCITLLKENGFQVTRL